MNMKAIVIFPPYFHGASAATEKALLAIKVSTAARGRKQNRPHFSPVLMYLGIGRANFDKWAAR